MKIKMIMKQLKENLNEEETNFLEFIINELKNFNNVYLLTNRFIDKIEETADKYFKLNTINETTKYHFYTSISFKFKIILKENKCSVKYNEYYKEIINTFGLDKGYIYDTDAEKDIKNNMFYYLIFLIKLI